MLNTYTVKLTISVEAYTLSSAVTTATLAIVDRNHVLTHGQSVTDMKRGPERLDVIDATVTKGGK